ncbi:uncharacterized protein LOC105425640 [Pogonomyrmex barbatus]|uniref:Uncharacterized protein LOC105425640 n=1 Tax=Pogonomyrmex barbatus TaxID=144034 RepID=A0A6I9W472_9HYME|nr:uncharacterized protein LOC105425640 [Pogonomyrmex barbatus]
MQSNTMLRSDVGSTEKLMGNNNNLNNNGSPGADIMFQIEDEGLTQLGSVFQSAYQSIVGGGPQVSPVLSRNATRTLPCENRDRRPHSHISLVSNRLPLGVPEFSDRVSYASLAEGPDWDIAVITAIGPGLQLTSDSSVMLALT